MNNKQYCHWCEEFYTPTQIPMICPYCSEADDNFDDEDDYRERMEEQKAEELAERAAMCKCGAWQFSKDGSVIHVADCCCGAE